MAIASDLILEAAGLSKSYGSIRALHDVHLELRTGEVLGVVGDNAAGKSTLLKILYGVTPADEGTIRVDGRHVAMHAPRDAQKLGIGMIFQDLALFNNLDIAANVFAGREQTRRILGVPFLANRRMAQESSRLLRRLRIDFASSRALVDRLSGGQRQMVGAARAIGGAPRILLMDEPTAALGVRETAAFLDLMRDLKNHNISVILVTHRLPDLFAVGDRILVLKGGQVQGVLATSQSDVDEVVALIVKGRERHSTREASAGT